MKNEKKGSMMKENILKTKSFAFAVRIVKLCTLLQKQKKEYVLSNQLLRSGTAIGALITEAEFGQSKADFISKLSISLKETNETIYWLQLLKATEYTEIKLLESFITECNELKALLVTSIKTTKKSA